MSYANPDAISQHIAEVIPLAPQGPPRMREPGEDEDALEGDFITEPPAMDEREIPAHLLDVPGLVGHIARWMTKTALYPQPGLSLGAAITIVGTAAGRKFQGPTKSGTQMYILALAGTGAGKNHPAKLGKRLLRAANMDEMIGPGQFMSEPAVYQHVSKQPVMLCFMDEMGSYLGRINNAKASGYEKGISGAFRSLWGCSFDTISPPAYAASSGKEAMKPIHSPCVSLYGMSVHEEFYAALSGADIANGFLNRFLVISTQQKPEEVEPELDDDEVPGALVDWLQRIAVTDPGRAQRPDGWKAEVKVDFDSRETRKIYEAFRKRIVTGSAEEAKLLGRIPEMSLRLATIRAIGRVKIGVPVICAEDMIWGTELALWSGQGMIADAASYMVESEYQGRALEVLRYIKAAPKRRLTLTDLSRKVKHKYDGATLRKILDGLRDSDQVEVTKFTAPGAKKPTETIQYIGG